MSNKNSQIKGKSSQKNLGLKGKSINDIANEQYKAREKENFVVSFQDLDKTQGQTFEDWEKDGLLLNMLNTLEQYCKKTIQENKGKSFKEYGYFPPKTKFKYPPHVPEDASWASLHLTGKQCLGGHIYKNVFNVVFLDKNHEFWISEKKHT